MNPLFLDIETTGLDPTSARVTCVGLLFPDRLWVITDVDETRILNSLSLMLARTMPPHLLVTFNGVKFDLPFLRKRYEIHGIDPGFCDWIESLQHEDLIVTSTKFHNASAGTALTRVSREKTLEFLNIYSPRCASALHCILAGVEPFPRNLPVTQHNALDLISTAQIYYNLKGRGWIVEPLEDAPVVKDVDVEVKEDVIQDADLEARIVESNKDEA